MYRYCEKDYKVVCFFFFFLSIAGIKNSIDRNNDVRKTHLYYETCTVFNYGYRNVTIITHF